MRLVCSAEMGHIAGLIATDASRTHRRHRVQRELLAAAARGNREVAGELLRLVTEPTDDGERSDFTLGWTAWHAAAAHGQADVLELLRQHRERSGHDQQALSQRTAAGLLPLAVACLQGHLFAVQALLRAEAEVDVQDVRGNTPLLWAAASSSSSETRRAVMDALIVAKADPLSKNCSGHEASVLMPIADDKDGYGGSAAMTKQQQQLDELMLAGGGGCTAEHEPFYCIRTASVHQFEQQSLLARTVGMLKPPVRDNIGFIRKAGQKAVSVLGQEACSLGVWTDWITNYTHAGLAVALDALQPPEHSPTHPQKSRQAAVLTHETLFLLTGATWSVVEKVPLADIVEIIISVYSETLLVLRVRRRQDILLDLVSRQRLLDELALAISEAAQQAHNSRRQQDLGVIVTSIPHPLVPLFDEGHTRIGTLAYVEPEVFLLLAFAPGSLLLAGLPTAAFGFLEMRQRTQPKAPGAGVRWRWRRHFFILKGGGKTERCLLWCHHPNAQQAIDYTPVDGTLQVKGADASLGEHCLVLDRAPSSSSCPPLPPLTLRAKTPSICQDWITAIRALQAGALP